MRFVSLLATVILLASSNLSAAPNQQKWSKRSGEHMVYYSVFNSQFINPEVAKSYNIVRAPNRALINISVTRVKDDGSETLGQPSTIEGYAQNLMGVVTPLNFRAISHPGTVYYIAEFRYSSREVINFYVDAKPDGTNKPIELAFSKKLYHEDK